MNNWERIEQIFDEAVELPPAERPVFLEEACQGDPILRAEVESLLDAESAGARLIPEAVSRLSNAIVADGESGRLGPYRLDRKIGEGGMGSVYCAVQEPLGRRVAVKVIRTETVSPEDIPMLRKRFAREAHATAALNHPTIVGLFDYGEVDEDELLFMVMEQVDGLSLRQVLRTKKRLPVALAVDLTDQVLSALQHAHEQGVVHRDLKPPNLLVVRRRGEAPVGGGAEAERGHRAVTWWCNCFS